MSVVTSALGTVLVAALLVTGSPSQAAGTGHVTGRVTGPGGALAGVTVSAYLQGPSGGWTEVQHDETDSAGDYDITGLDEGQYTLGFYDGPGGSAGEYWDDVTSLSLATAFPVGSGAVGPKDAELAPGRHLRGTVRGDGGVPLAGVEVSAYPSQAVGGEQVVVEFAVTDEHGAFDVGRLPAGSYRLGFRDNAGTYASEFWQDQPTLAQATDIEVSGDVAGIAAVLARPSQPTPPPPAAAGTVVNRALPALSGKARVGKKLRVWGGSWSPGEVSLSYQWLANGKPLQGATGPVLKLKQKLLGKKVTVRVTAAAAGHTPTTVTTAPSKKVKPRKK
jgi:hypothetical protein